MERRKQSYRKLIVWQKSMNLVETIYTMTRSFPDDERFRLTSQMRRAVISIPSNIAEGNMRSTDKDFANFLTIAYASGAELETQFELARRLRLCHQDNIRDAEQLLEEIMKMLNVLVSKQKNPSQERSKSLTS